MSDRSPRIGPGAFVAPAARLGPGVEVGPGAVILADEGSGPPTIIEQGASIGANATVSAGVTVGFGARLRPGAVVDRSVPPRAIVEGNPARIVGYVDAASSPAVPVPAPAPSRSPRATRVRGVTLHELHQATDIRGSLAAAEVGREIPFQPVRWFVVFDVPSVETRGQHAHRSCDQLLVSVSGSLRVVADDGDEREEFLLDRPTLGLYVPAMTWAVQYGYSADAALLVLASEPYDPADYIRDYATFLDLVNASPRPG